MWKYVFGEMNVCI